MGENRELVRRFIADVFEARRSEAVDGLVSDDFVSHTWGTGNADKAYLLQATERMAKALTDVEFTIEDAIAEGDRVAVRLTASATATGDMMGLPAAGKRYTIGEIHIFRVADGKIAEHWHQYDSAGMMRQLGGGGDG